MANIGEATLRIVADTSSFQRAINNLSQDRGIFNKADSVGARFGERVGKATGKAMKVGLLAAAGGIAAVVGVTLAKGFKRFTTIEDATASLTLLLGDATKAASLLDKTLKVVEGTPFALEDFVDATRNLVANNVKLAEVPRVLQAIADAAAAAGGDAQSVNDVANSFGRMATGAQLTLGPIRELEEKGVPALRILANKWGIAAEDLAKDISKGSVDSQKAIRDLTDGILEGTEGINGATVAYGGAAKNVGNTVSGAYANMQTAVARAGANIIKVFADGSQGGRGLVKILNSARRTIDVMGQAAVRLAERFVEGGGMDKVLDFFERLENRIAAASEHIGEEGGFRKALLTLFDAKSFEDLAAKALDGLRRAFENLPSETLGGVFTTILVRSIEAVAASTAIIVGAVIKAAPQIIKGIGEGLLKAAKDNPLNMALFIAALGVPGVGPALAGLFGALPFGFITKPLITGLTKAIGFALGRGTLVTPDMIQGSLFPPSTLRSVFGPGGKIAAAMRGLGPVLVAAMAGWAIGSAIEKHIVAPIIKEFTDLEDHVTGQTASMKDRFVTTLGNMGGVGSKQLFPVVRVLNEMQREGDLTNEAMARIFDQLQLIGAAAKNGIDVRDALIKIAAGGSEADKAVRELRAKLVALGETRVEPTIQMDPTQALAAIEAIRRGLAGISGGGAADLVLLNAFHAGGLVMHKGGFVPKLHSGTLNRAAGSLSSKLRSDERLAVLQVGELVLSKGQVAQAKQNGSTAASHTFIINEVGDSRATVERIVARVATA